MITAAGFRNTSGLEFSSLETEEWREYQFKDLTVRITNPLKLNVSKSGGHRVFDAQGLSHYIPSGWVRLTWSTKDGASHFEF